MEMILLQGNEHLLILLRHVSLVARGRCHLNGGMHIHGIANNGLVS
jgi:hypothetical protein